MKISSKRSLAILCLNLITWQSFSQQVDIFKTQDSLAVSKNEPVVNTFYSTRLVNSHTVEITGKGSMDFRINHRFGPLNQGLYEWFGLDQASMRMGFDFGLSDNLQVGIGRTTYFKEYDGYIKYRLLRQRTNSTPLSITWVGAFAWRSFDYNSIGTIPKVTGSDKTYYTTQLLIGSKLTNNTSLQISPTYTHYNRLLGVTGGSTDLFSIGFLARQKVSKRMSINAEYFLQTKRFDGMSDPLSVGVDINTGGHVFQLHFTNSTGMNEHTFIHETSGSWFNAVRWGFNISRIFHIGKR